MSYKIKVDLETINGVVEAPTYATMGASGADVVANTIVKAFKGYKEVEPEKLKRMQETFAREGVLNLRPYERVLVGTGIKVHHIPEGCEIQVRSRSGVTLKRGLIVANSPGTVDSDYKGEIGVIIYNSTPYLNPITKGEKIAQLVLAAVYKMDFGDTDSSKIRGEGGFGSTGQ